MNLPARAEPQPLFLQTLQPLLASVEAASRIWGEACSDLLKIQSESAAAALAQGLTSLVPAYAPGDSSYLLTRMPIDYQMQLERLAQLMRDSLDVLSRAHYELLAWQSQPLTQGIEAGEAPAALVFTPASAPIY
jgi:hypothetical protein